MSITQDHALAGPESLATAEDASTTRSTAIRVVGIALLAAILAVAAYRLQGNIGLALSDEGQLWYITARTAAGDVPMRDVRGYEPGRYYVGAAWFKAFGPGILSLRASLGAVAAVGVFFGLLALTRVVRRWWLVALLALVLLAWTFPLYKAYESALVLVAIWIMTRVVERPSVARLLAGGTFVGIAGFFRVDHALYAAVALALAALIARHRGLIARPLRAALAAAGGIVVGYAPMLVMLATVPGFAGGFVEHLAYRVRLVQTMGDTNLPKAVPWPWLAPRYFAQVGPLEGTRLLVFGLLMLIVPVFFAVAAVLVVRDARRGDALLVAATVVGIPYLHFAFSRPDIEHLAPVMGACVVAVAALVGILVGARRVVTAALVPLAVLATYLTVGRQSPYALRASAPVGSWVTADIAGDAVWVPRPAAMFFERMQRVNRELIGADGRVFIAPFWPGLYAVLERPAPVWDIYVLAPETEASQRATIARLRDQRVDWAIVDDVAIDGRDEFRFSAWCPLVWRHLHEAFDPVAIDGIPSHVKVFRRRASSQADRR